MRNTAQWSTPMRRQENAGALLDIFNVPLHSNMKLWALILVDNTRKQHFGIEILNSILPVAVTEAFARLMNKFGGVLTVNVDNAYFWHTHEFKACASSLGICLYFCPPSSSYKKAICERVMYLFSEEVLNKATFNSIQDVRTATAAWTKAR